MTTVDDIFSRFDKIVQRKSLGRRHLWKAILRKDYGEVERHRTTNWLEANLVSSRYSEDKPVTTQTTMGVITVTGPEMHMPAIDLDIPHEYIPSSTPGHGHLYLNVPLTWDQYQSLLKALLDAKIIEQGFYDCSVRDGQSFLRRPGVKKKTIESEPVYDDDMYDDDMPF